jgi:CRP-like cAMP-binding protein
MILSPVHSVVGKRVIAPLDRRGGNMEAYLGGKPRIRPVLTSVSNRLPNNRVLFWQGETQSREIEIVEGVVRAVRLLPNGGRQILTFFWPGATISRNIGSIQSYTAETVTTCVLRFHGPASAAARTQHANGANDQVLEETLQLLEAISRRVALSRVAWFLMRIREHLPRMEQGDEVLKFIVPRKDIADHIGLSLETVCRSLTMLKERGVIELPNRKTIRFRSIAALAHIAKEKRLECR